METFNIRDLRNRTGDLVRTAESGRLSVVTKHGRPVFLALPLTDHLLREGALEALAVQLFKEGTVSLGKAAKLAGLPVERFLEALATAGVDAVTYPPEELEEELQTLSGA